MFGRELELIVMSVTRLSTGVCVACVTEDGTWVRPTRERAKGWRQLEVEDLRDKWGQLVVRPGNVIRWRLGKPIPRDIHTEDRRVRGGRPTLLRCLALDEFLGLCSRLCETGLAGFLVATDRSLALIEPRLVTWLRFDTSGKGGVKAEASFIHDGKSYRYKVTDLAWRALGRRLLHESASDEITCSLGQFLRQEGLAIRYLAVGRGQEFQGAFWPFVITVVTEPLNEEPIDYGRT